MASTGTISSRVNHGKMRSSEVSTAAWRDGLLNEELFETDARRKLPPWQYDDNYVRPAKNQTPAQARRTLELKTGGLHKTKPVTIIPADSQDK